MSTPVWIGSETIVALHEQLLSSFGGAAGVRDKDVLRAALAAPEQAFAADKASVFSLAATYCRSLLSQRPFVDGNLILAFATAALFLELNGYRLRASEADAAIRTLAFAAEAMDETDYAGWLLANARRIEAPGAKKP